MFGLSDFAARIVLWVLGAAVVVSVVTGSYFYWKGSIRDAALEDFNKKQIEQVIKDAQQFQKEMSQVTKDQQEIIKKKDEQIKQLESVVSQIEEYLDSPEAKKSDRQASDVLKNTVKKLKGTVYP